MSGNIHFDQIALVFIGNYYQTIILSDEDQHSMVKML